MLFVEPVFLFLFLPFVVYVHRLRVLDQHHSIRAAWLFVASIIFYMTWDYRSTIFLFVSIVLNFVLARIIQKYVTAYSESKAKAFLIIALVFNLGSLAFSKYWITIVQAHFGFLMPQFLKTSSPWFPVGISFFAFTQIAYQIDSYRQRADRTSLLSFASFVVFFPHLVAGPILRHSETLSELQRGAKATDVQVIEGAQLIIRGMFRKTVIADPLGSYIHPLIISVDSGTMFSSAGSWLIIICYALQLYCDFSGYSLMALGASRMLGFNIPINFDAPYRSIGIIDFWRRWHISLSVFLRDYLYIPLGGSKKGRLLHARNLLLTMTLGGLWHGSTLNFGLWGLIHGIFLTAEHLFRARIKSIVARRWDVPIQFLTFILVVIAWVPFRVETLQSALSFWGAMFGFSRGMNVPAPSTVFVPFVIGVALVLGERRSRNVDELVVSHHHSALSYLVYGTVLVIALVASGATSEFLYARF